MKHQLRSAVCTEGRRMAGARALWVANGMKREQFGKPIIAIVNSFTQFVPGHTHLHEAGQIVKEEIEKLWGIKNYSSLNIIYAFHPSAHLSKARDKYIEELCSFVSQT